MLALLLLVLSYVFQVALEPGLVRRMARLKRRMKRLQMLLHTLNSNTEDWAVVRLGSVEVRLVCRFANPFHAERSASELAATFARSYALVCDPDGCLGKDSGSLHDRAVIEGLWVERFPLLPKEKEVLAINWRLNHVHGNQDLDKKRA